MIFKANEKLDLSTYCNVIVQAVNIESASSKFKQVYGVYPARLECIDASTNHFISVGMQSEEDGKVIEDEV